MNTTYLDIASNLVDLTNNTVAYIRNDDDFPVRVVDGLDAAEETCYMALSTATADISAHPLNSYNTTYPYARTAIRIRIDDPKPEDQIAQLVAVAPFLIVRVIVEDFQGRKVRPATMKATVGPDQLYPCALVVFFNHFTFEPYILIDTTVVTKPARLTLAITDAIGRSRTGWLGLRDKRTGVPSGAIL